MGQNQANMGGNKRGDGAGDGADKVCDVSSSLSLKVSMQDKKKRYEPPLPTRIGKRRRGGRGPDAATKLPQVVPTTKCRLRLVKLERINDYLLMEEEFIRNQERLKPQEERQEVHFIFPCPLLNVTLFRKSAVASTTCAARQ